MLGGVYSELTYETRGEVGVITLDRPEARNALTHTTYDELRRAVESTTARCLVVTGTDPAFCSGDDVKQIMAAAGPAVAERLAAEPRLTPAAAALLATDVPVVAAVNGAAVGWGMELALMADIRIASERARFGELFVKRGLCCDVAGLGRLAQLVGREVAADLLFTGRLIDAEEALRVRLVSRVVPHSELMAARARGGGHDRRQPAARRPAPEAGPPTRPRPRLGRPRALGERQPRRAVPHRRPPRRRRRVPRKARPALTPADER